MHSHARRGLGQLTLYEEKQVAHTNTRQEQHHKRPVTLSCGWDGWVTNLSPPLRIYCIYAYMPSWPQPRAWSPYPVSGRGWVAIYIYIYVYMYVYIHTYIHTYVCIHSCMCVRSCVCACACAPVRVCVHVCACVRVRMCVWHAACRCVRSV